MENSGLDGSKGNQTAQATISPNRVLRLETPQLTSEKNLLLQLLEIWLLYSI